MATHKEALTLALELLAVGTFHSPELQAKRTEVIEQGLKALAQPEQEPVAIIHRNEYNEYRLEPHDNFDIKSIPFNVDVSLFKSPQRTWVGLTDDEFQLIYDMGRTPAGMMEMVEAKLKEKNNA